MSSAGQNDDRPHVEQMDSNIANTVASSCNTLATVGPVSLSGPTYQLNPLGNTNHHPRLTAAYCCISILHILSWLWSIMSYVIECASIVLALWYYGTEGAWLYLGLTLGFLVLPTFLLMGVSLVWYYRLDHYYTERGTEGYKRRVTTVSILLHCSLLGLIYRYGELCYLTLIAYPKLFLRLLARDAALIRLMHGFLTSAPLIVIQLYIIAMATHPDNTTSSPPHTVTYVVLGACTLSLLYSVLSFTTSDRFAISEKRRPTLPAHILLTLWYVSIIAARIISFAIFSLVYGQYVLAVYGGHWLVSFLGLLFQRTTFCNDGESRRLWLEIPWNVIAAFMYEFANVNLKEGNMRYWLLGYYFLIFSENSVMSILFFLDQMTLSYAPVALSLAVGLTILGMFFMITYYIVFHPRKTGDWYWLGCPKRGGGCFSKAERLNIRDQNHSHDISMPTSFQHVTLNTNNGMIEQTPTSRPQADNCAQSHFQPSDVHSLQSRGYTQPLPNNSRAGSQSYALRIVDVEEIDGLGLGQNQTGEVTPMAYTITQSELSQPSRLVAEAGSHMTLGSVDSQIDSPLPTPVFSDGEEEEEETLTEGTVTQPAAELPLQRSPSPYDKLSPSGDDDTLPRNMAGYDTLPRSMASSDQPISFSDSTCTGTGHGSPGCTPLPLRLFDSDETHSTSPSPLPTPEPSPTINRHRDPTSGRPFTDIPAKQHGYIHRQSRLEQHYFPDSQTQNGKEGTDSKASNHWSSPSHTRTTPTFINGQPQRLPQTPTHNFSQSPSSHPHSQSPAYSYSNHHPHTPQRSASDRVHGDREARNNSHSSNLAKPPRRTQPYLHVERNSSEQPISSYSHNGPSIVAHSPQRPRRVTYPPVYIASLSQPEPMVNGIVGSYRDAHSLDSSSSERVQAHIPRLSSEERSSSSPERTRPHNLTSNQPSASIDATNTSKPRSMVKHQSVHWEGNADRVNGTGHSQPPPRSPRGRAVSEGGDRVREVYPGSSPSRYSNDLRARPFPPHVQSHHPPTRNVAGSALNREHPHSSSYTGGRGGLVPNGHLDRRGDPKYGLPTLPPQGQDHVQTYWQKGGSAYARVRMQSSGNADPQQNYYQWRHDGPLQRNVPGSPSARNVPGSPRTRNVPGSPRVGGRSRSTSAGRSGGRLLSMPSANAHVTQV